MKISDYIAEFLASQGVEYVFGLTGAHALHLIDSISRHPKLRFIPFCHEQGAVFAADAYARVTGKVGVVLSTSGPGAVNLISGACSAYFDSVPMVIFTGQVATSHLQTSPNLRQLGFQETPILAIFGPIVKKAIGLYYPKDTNFWLEEAFHIATEGRKGPVLIDLPDDVQRAETDEMEAYCPEVTLPYGDIDIAPLLVAQRPIVILGAGIHQADVEIEAIRFVEALGWPVLLSWGGMDLLPYGHPLNMGGFGICGPRAGNMAVQNADLILSLGCRLNMQMTGPIKDFASNAKIVMVDIDENELARFPDAKVFPCDLNQFLSHADIKASSDFNWFEQIRRWRRQYPVGPGTQNEIDPYKFLGQLSDMSQEGDIIVTDAGATLAWVMQTWKVKKGQRIISSWNHSPMGWALPGAIGAGLTGRRIICITGDGAFQMNIQELATLARLDLNVKVFVLDNRGYGIIRQTQDTWLEGRHFASEFEGIGIEGLTNVYGINAYRMDEHVFLDRMLNPNESWIGIVPIAPDARIVPKLGKGQKLEEIT